MLPLIIFKENEDIQLELETSISDGDKNREVDIMININNGIDVYRIAIELKCYKTYASSGGKRGAHDIFMKDVYCDLELVEKYISHAEANEGMVMVMTDYSTFIFPTIKSGKCWGYDISQGTKVGNINITTPIGGYPINMKLKKMYEFNWNKVGDYYFTILEGM
jgi:hypothetical protein